MQNERQPEIGHRSHATIQRVQEAHRKSMPMRGIFLYKWSPFAWKFLTVTASCPIVSLISYRKELLRREHLRPTVPFEIQNLKPLLPRQTLHTFAASRTAKRELIRYLILDILAPSQCFSGIFPSKMKYKTKNVGLRPGVKLATR